MFWLLLLFNYAAYLPIIINFSSQMIKLLNKLAIKLSSKELKIPPLP